MSIENDCEKEETKALSQIAVMRSVSDVIKEGSIIWVKLFKSFFYF